jgi:murein L,D-transpeptidase YcbB/YkuD
MHRWLMGAPLPGKVKGIEQVERLPEIMPIYITYLTALPSEGQIAFHADPYGKDGLQLAAVDDDAGRADRP